MKRLALWALAVSLLWGAAARASDPAGIYALVDRVELQPNEQNPERIKLWGAFCLAAGRGDEYLPPAQGYMYFSLVKDHERECRAEWADFERVAGTGQCVAFGNRYGVKRGVRQAKLHGVRQAKLHSKPDAPADPRRIGQLITDLDNKQFSVRENASQELGSMGETTLPALRKALAARPSEEARKRLERLVNKEEPDVYPLGVGVIKVNSGTNYDTDYPPIRALLQLPGTKAPSDGSLEPPGSITLVARNIWDRKHHSADYLFEIEDAAGAKESSPPVPAGEKETKWSPRMKLKAGEKYAWRVWATDREWKSPAARAVFIVKGQQQN
jgi:hypothetical protein